MGTSIGELNLMTDTEQRFRVNERIEEFHARNGDWERVMRDKWALAMWGQKGGN